MKMQETRDFFAAHIAQGVLAGNPTKELTENEFARFVFHLADAMMEERQKNHPNST